MFIHHMFAADTELDAALSGTSGLMQFLQEQRNLTVELVQEVWRTDEELGRAGGGPGAMSGSASTRGKAESSSGRGRWIRRVCGAAVLPLQQFKSSFVVKLDVYAPVGVTMGATCLKVRA